MPRVFGSEDPQLVYGFVVLVNVFRTVDDEFVTTWKALPPSSTTACLDLHKGSDDHGTQPAEVLGNPGFLQSQELNETQRIDILVTQQWLRILMWQMHVNQKMVNHHAFRNWAPAGPGRARPATTYPFDVSHDLLGLISTADRQSLECHGIGIVCDSSCPFLLKLIYRTRLIHYSLGTKDI